MAVSVKPSGPVFSGGLEETYTDFDGWLTRRNWIHRHRPYHRAVQETNPARKDGAVVGILQDSLVNGLCNIRLSGSGYPVKAIIGMTHYFKQSDDGVQLDLVFLRLLRENGRRRFLLVNKSKL